jgi:hypothetical protein
MAGISFRGKNLRAELQVNSISVELNPFTEQFLARTIVGAVSSLKGAEVIETLEVVLEKSDLRIVVNSNELQLTPFPKDIIVNTIKGMVSSLKGVGKIDTLRMRVGIEG